VSEHCAYFHPDGERCRLIAQMARGFCPVHGAMHPAGTGTHADSSVREPTLAGREDHLARGSHADCIGRGCALAQEGRKEPS
jgi:hypothetical protein